MSGFRGLPVSSIYLTCSCIPPEDKLMVASRLCLSRALHLPPQVVPVILVAAEMGLTQ